MERIALPFPVDGFVAAVNRHDATAFLGFFPSDGVVDDWGQRMVGHAAIKQWSDEQFIGAHGTITPISVSQEEGVIRLKAGWKSSFFSSNSEFVFTVKDGLVRELRIPPH